MKAARASACTDVTGFGLFGHLWRMTRTARLTVEVLAEALPAFPGALDSLRQGIIPGAIERNREFVGEALEVAPGVDEALVNLGCDAQTSGGLLIAAEPARLEALQSELAQRGVECFVVGRFLEPSGGKICVVNSASNQSRPPRRQEPESSTPAEPKAGTPMNMSTSPPDPGAHPANCCAEIFETKPSGSTASETQKAFGAMMQSAQAAGALSAKAKELILFSLVVQSRCAPCFDAHLAKARELGITQAELDEAAWCAIAMGGAPVRMFYLECLRRAGKP
jgi:AhpD family alkylhydroperoxidase